MKGTERPIGTGNIRAKPPTGLYRCRCPTRQVEVGLVDNQGFFFAAAEAFAAFFLLLRIITSPRKVPTTADPSSVKMTGMRIAQTRGGKRS